MDKIYYRGIKKGRKPIGYKTGVYYTKYPEEAKIYAGEDGKIIRAEINPKKPLQTETFPDSAKKLGLWNRDFERLLMDNPGRAHIRVANAARRRGYDTIVRREGDWVIALKPQAVRKQRSLGARLIKGY